MCQLTGMGSIDSCGIYLGIYPFIYLWGGGGGGEWVYLSGLGVGGTGQRTDERTHEGYTMKMASNPKLGKIGKYGDGVIDYMSDG